MKCIIVIILFGLINICVLLNRPYVDIKSLKNGQGKMTDMFMYFDSVCRQNNLKYWALGGTLIGAIRHQGWIPWDGDVDLGMLQSDYDKFRDIMKNNLPPNMVFEHRPPNKPCSKLRLLDAHYTPSPFGFHWDDDDGIQLDIFVFKSEGGTISGNSPICGRPDRNSRPYSDIFPLRELPFEDLTIYVPNKYERISKEVWGGNPPPMLPAKDRYPHEGNIICNSITTKMIEKYDLKNRPSNRGITTEHGKVVKT